jgi:hypothetical protein
VEHRLGVEVHTFGVAFVVGVVEIVDVEGVVVEE